MRVKDVWVPLAALLAYVFIRVLSWTWRVQFVPEDSLEKARALKDGRYLLACWHENHLAAMFCHLDVKGATLASRRNAGRILALTIKRFGWDAIRGSRKRGGKEAREAMIRYLQERQRPVAITVDGASGPRRQTKPGILAIATRTNVPIVPAVGLASRCWVIKNSWDQLRVPKPFATLSCAYGEAMHPPADLQGAAFDAYLVEINKSLNRLEAELAQKLGHGLPPFPDGLIEASEKVPSKALNT